ncbi:MAG: bifunctional riboflavin kinase/FAD synthetase [Actinomycetota bacterium]
MASGDMIVHRGLEALPLQLAASTVTVGFFDGVHRGHRAVLGRAVEVARSRGIPSVAVTFDKHPREILTPGREPRLLTSVERKAELIASAGIDHLVVLEFTESVSRWTPEKFMDQVLATGLRAAHVVIGANFTFGHKAAGTIGTLRAHADRCGFTAEAVELVDIDGRRVSSSSIREALAAGDLMWPTAALGRRFVLDGEVVAGAGRGKGLGYPTANLRTWPRLLLPGSGIYAGSARVADGRFVAAISCGTNPTFGSEPLHVEAYLLDFAAAELRGDPIAVSFHARLRDEERFDGPEALTDAIAQDVERTRALVDLSAGD